jgi:DNA-binding NarL/FixJ family response regulator
MGGMETLRRLKATAPRLRTVILSDHQESEYARLAVSAGADGFVAKDCVEEDLFPLLEHRAVHVA